MNLPTNIYALVESVADTGVATIMADRRPRRAAENSREWGVRTYGTQHGLTNDVGAPYSLGG